MSRHKFWSFLARTLRQLRVCWNRESRRVHLIFTQAVPAQPQIVASNALFVGLTGALD
jgi:hypothetical protein